jgi:hypothetical protein
MSSLSARARVFLFLLVVAAPVTATLAIEHAARPPAAEFRNADRQMSQPASAKPEADTRSSAAERGRTR